MAGLAIAVIIFNFVALKAKIRLTKSQILQVWLFTSCLQLAFDLFVSIKFQGYWYFTKNVDWQSLLVYFWLVPPVNLVYLNFYPFKSPIPKQIFYIISWSAVILLYEGLTLLPEPWGYFHYGWWTIWHSVILNPILFFILVKYYKWILKLEKESMLHIQKDTGIG